MCKYTMQSLASKIFAGTFWNVPPECAGNYMINYISCLFKQGAEQLEMFEQLKTYSEYSLR